LKKLTTQGINAPNTIVVKNTRINVVDISTSLFIGDVDSILIAKPKAMAPLIDPAKHIIP
jgi:hypothetical protein